MGGLAEPVKHQAHYTVENGTLVPEKTLSIAEVRQKIEAAVRSIKDRIPKHRMVARRDGYEQGNRGSRDVRIRTEPVCWGIPMDEFMFARWFSNFLDLGVQPWDDNITNLNTYIYTARNYIHDAFLDGSKCTWLVGLDSDVLPPSRFLDSLMRAERKFIAGWYRQKGKGMHPVVYDWKGDMTSDGKGKRYLIRREPGKGVEQVSAIGLGCYIMHREVAEKLGRSPYRMNFEGNDYSGEDLMLCDRLNELGYGVWVHWDVACAHTGMGIY